MPALSTPPIPLPMPAEEDVAGAESDGAPASPPKRLPEAAGVTDVAVAVDAAAGAAACSAAAGNAAPRL